MTEQTPRADDLLHPEDWLVPTDPPETDLTKLTLEQLVASGVPGSVDRDYPGTRDEIIAEVVQAITAGGFVRPAPAPNILGYGCAAVSPDGMIEISPLLPTEEDTRSALAYVRSLANAAGSAKKPDIRVVRVTEVEA